MKWRGVILLLGSGCTWFEPELAPLTDAPLLVPAEEGWVIETSAHQPTDLVALEGGGLAVLDGYRETLWTFGPDRALEQAHALDGLSHRPTRATASADGGIWLMAPDSPELVHLSTEGQRRILWVHHEDEAPVQGMTGALDRGAELVVILAEGAVARVDAVSGRILSLTEADVNGDPFRAPVHLSSVDSGLLVTDTFGPQVHRLDPSDLSPSQVFGHQGLWIGSLAKPKASVQGPAGSLAVVDSELSAVQLFEIDGEPLGVLARDGAPWDLGYPIAMVAFGPDTLAVLDADSGRVVGIRVQPGDVEANREAVASYRHLRHDIISPDYHERLADGVLCRHCHDGLVLDDRQNWDPDLYHHPVGKRPENPVPEFFPLDEDGRIVCTTCHSPHGTVEVADVQAVEEGTDPASLVRHQAQEGDLFTRLSRENTELCIACHSESAHDRVLEQLDLAGSAHPTGAELERALRARDDLAQGEDPLAGLPAEVDGTCLTCHAVHAAPHEKLTRDTTATELCVACHQDQSREAGNHLLHRRLQYAYAAAEAGLHLVDNDSQSCRTCHDLVGGGVTEALLHDVPSGDLCTTCHEPLTGGHGRLEGRHELGCLECHSVHDAPPGDGLLATRVHATEGDAQGCLGCHAADAPDGQADVHPNALGHPPVEGSCSDCHDPHEPHEIPTCGSCHEDEQHAVDRGGHGTASCMDCHPPHQDPPILTAALHPPGEELNPYSAQCLACHAPGAEGAETEVGAWDHPAPVFTLEGKRWTPLGHLPLFDARGEAVPATLNGALTCGTCHTTHGPDASDPKDKLRRPRWQEACASCHGDEARKLYEDFHTLERTWEGAP